MTTENVVLLKDLANEFGLDRSNVRRYVLKSGFEFIKVRTKASRGQLTLALTPEDAEAVRDIRRSQGFSVGGKAGKQVVDNGMGLFYVIQLVPELEAGRVKLGFTRDLDSRLGVHRTAAPTAEVLKTWPCNRNWELAAIASITCEGCKPLSGEVYITQDLQAFLERGDAFFALMP